MFLKKMKNGLAGVEATPILLLIVFFTPSCISATQATAAPTTIAGRTGQLDTYRDKERPTDGVADRSTDSASGSAWSDSQNPSHVSSLSGPPDDSLFGFNLGMEAEGEPASALNPYLFSLPDKLRIPTDSISARPDYRLFGLEAAPAEHLASMSGVVLKHDSLKDTDQIPVHSLSGRPNYRLYGLE